MNRATLLFRFSAFLTAGVLVLPSLAAQNRNLDQSHALSPSTRSSANNQQPATSDAKQVLLASISKLCPEEISDSGKAGLLEAIDLFLKNDVEGARVRLGKICEEEPSFPPQDFVVSGLFFTAGNNLAGIQALESAASTHPEYPSIYSGFARIAINQNRFTDAYALSQIAIQSIANGQWTEKQIDFFRVEALDSLADIMIKRQNWELAIKHLNELHALLPENERVMLKLAQVFFEREDYDQALENLQTATSLVEQVQKPEVTMADWFLVKRNVEESRKWIERAVATYPEDGRVMLAMAQWQLRNRELAEAAASAQKSEDLGADMYDATFVKGQISFTQRNYEDAAVHFETLNRTKPGDVEASNLLILSLIESQDQANKEKALQLATMNQKIYPRNPAILSTLGWTYFKNGKIQEAKQIFQNLVNVRPMPPATGYFIANFLADNGDVQAASEILKATLESDGYYIYRDQAQQMYDELVAKLPKSQESPDDAADSSGSESTPNGKQ